MPHQEPQALTFILPDLVFRFVVLPQATRRRLFLRAKRIGQSDLLVKEQPTQAQAADWSDPEATESLSARTRLLFSATFEDPRL